MPWRHDLHTFTFFNFRKQSRLISQLTLPPASCRRQQGRTQCHSYDWVKLRETAVTSEMRSGGRPVHVEEMIITLPLPDHPLTRFTLSRTHCATWANIVWGRGEGWFVTSEYYSGRATLSHSSWKVYGPNSRWSPLDPTRRCLLPVMFSDQKFVCIALSTLSAVLYVCACCVLQSCCFSMKTRQLRSLNLSLRKTEPRNSTGL